MKLDIGIGVTSKISSFWMLKEVAAKAMSTLEKEPELGIIFATPQVLKDQRIIGILLRALPSMKVVGVTTRGIIYEDEVVKDGLGIILFSFPEYVSCKMEYIHGLSRQDNYALAKNAGERLLKISAGMPRNLGVMFFGGGVADGSLFLEGLQEKLGVSFPFVGGCASSFEGEAPLFFSEQKEEDAAAIILWDGRLGYSVSSYHGWRPIGKPRLITRAEGNIVYEIDEEPACKIYQEYTGLNINMLTKEIQRISTFYPLGIYLEGEGEYLLRNVSYVDTATGALVLRGSVKQGDTIRMMIGTKESCLGVSRQAAEELKEELKDKHCKVVVAFVSASRAMLLGRQARDEIKLIKDTLIDKTLVGIYTYGEQAPLKSLNYLGRSYFYNQSITLWSIYDKGE